MATNPIGPTVTAWLHAEQHGLRPATITTYRRHLASFAGHVGHDLPLAHLTVEHVEGWLDSIAHLQASTRRTRLAAVRAFTGWAVQRELLDRDPAAMVRAPKVRRRPPPRARTDDLARVLALAEPRDRVMLVVLLQTAIRRGELAGLQVGDWDGAGRLYIADAKGWRERWVSVPAEAQRELTHWVALLGRPDGPMWPSSHRPGHGLAPGTISHLVAQAGRRAGVKLWTHLLRHTALSDAAAGGATSHQLQRQSGHRYSSTLDHYVHLELGEVADAMEGRRYRAVG